MMGQVGTLFLLSFALTFGLSLLQAQSGALATEIGVDSGIVDRVGSALVRLVGLGVPYVLTFGMIVQLYYFIPRPHPPKRSAALGAAVTAVLFELGKNGFAVYATYIGNFDRYAASDEGLGGLGGVFGLILALVFWIYVSGLILVVGAFVTRLHERRLQPRRQAAVRRLWKRLGTERRRVRRQTQEVSSETDAPDGPDRDAAPDALGDGTPGDALPSPPPVVPPPVGAHGSP